MITETSTKSFKFYEKRTDTLFRSFKRGKPFDSKRGKNRMAAERILIVDDDEAILKSLEKFFNRRNFETLLARDGETALYLYESGKPSLLLADIRLPRSNGLDIIQHIKNIEPDFPSILMSGNPPQDFILRGLKLGAEDFLVKPINATALQSTVERLLIKYKEKNNLKVHAENLKQMVETQGKELLKTQKELSQAAKMSALGELAAGLAHEVNQPLTALKLTCEDALYCLSKSDFNIEEIKDSLKEMLTHMDMLSGIIRHMRVFSRSSEEDDYQDVDLNNLSKNILNFANYQLKTLKINIELELANNLPLSYCHPVKVQQVLMNLVANARDALIQSSKENKSIKIVSKVVPYLESQDAVMISIQDNADGIPLEIQNRIFTPFFTTKDSSKGTGLGLSISKKIIEGMGGRLQFETKIGEGSSFNLILPIQSKNKEKK